jgi:hypothetical protein
MDVGILFEALTGDPIALAGPCAEVDFAASLGAKGTKPIFLGGIGGPFADGASHRAETSWSMVASHDAGIKRRERF